MDEDKHQLGFIFLTIQWREERRPQQGNRWRQVMENYADDQERWVRSEWMCKLIRLLARLDTIVLAATWSDEV